MEMKRSMRPMAVTISGFMTGRLLTSRTMLRRILFALLRPMAATVPTTVETTVATTATISVVVMLSIIIRLENMLSYHFREKPEKLVMDFPSLKEKRTR